MVIHRKKFLLRLGLWVGMWMCALASQAQEGTPQFLSRFNNTWVDSVFQKMSVDQKIGQLLMPRGNYSGKPHDLATLSRWVSEYHVGGIVFFASSPIEQAQVTNAVQSLARIPLFIGQDFEWGLGMRLDSTDRFPYAMTLGATQGMDLEWYQMGEEIGRQCRRIGVHVNYAPVVDVNNNPSNPVINFRSFGSNKEKVTLRGLAIMQGIQSQNVLCTAKHFPGHGDTDVDSHHDLPVISHKIERLRDVELFPFKGLIDNGLSGIMTAHLSIPAVEKKPGLASTFSKAIISDLLKEKMAFEGLIFTDAMEMKGAIKNFPKGEAMVQALLAGNDILETFMDVPTAFEAIKKAISEGRLPMDLVDQKVKKILKAKSWVGLDNYQPIDTVGLIDDLNTYKAKVLNTQFAEASITCLSNLENLLPIKDLTQRIALLSIGDDGDSHFPENLALYAPVDHFSFGRNADAQSKYRLDSIVQAYPLVIMSMHFNDIRASKKYGLSDHIYTLVESVVQKPHVITILFGNILILNELKTLNNSPTLMTSYQYTAYAESAMAQAIFGAIDTKGQLPLDLNDTFKEGQGIKLAKIGRLAYGLPEQVGLDGPSLYASLDSLLYIGIAEKAYPGAVLQVGVKGRVIYRKAIGNTVYIDNQEVNGLPRQNTVQYTNKKIDDAMDNFGPHVSRPQQNQINQNVGHPLQMTVDHIFDLASVTKVTTSALAIMNLTTQNKFDIDKPWSYYYPPYRKTNKDALTFRALLTHTSGLKAWIPFWKYAIDSTSTMLNAIQTNPNLIPSVVYDIHKPNFIKRLFGAKTDSIINLKSTMALDPSFMDKILDKKSIVWKKDVFSPFKKSEYTIHLSDSLWMHSRYAVRLFEGIKESAINTDLGYVYSDMHFYTYPEIIHSLTNMSFDEFLYRIYNEVGASTLKFNPRRYFPLDIIVPTEYDSLFRQSLIHGYVHDEGAALLNGVSGHAGLFGNANDVMKIMQLYLNKGAYGGKRYITDKIVDEWTKYAFPDLNIRRGIAFDKKDFNPSVSNAPVNASELAFGHSGFTGTYVWVDPMFDLNYVFLSNRVYPTRENKKLITLNIRPKIGELLIKAIQKSK